MDLESRLHLIRRNLEEVVTEEDLVSALSSGKKLRAYVGYEPSGEIHLGHVMTVNKLMDLQNAGIDIVVLLADVHAYLNEKGDFDEIREIAEYNRRAFIALGLEESKVEFVLGSDFQLERDYILDVLKMARITTLKRARRSMDEVSRRKEDPMVSQMVYPLMQALDIAHLRVDLAVGGIDQRKIHMLARENLPRLGYPSPICLHTPILLGLDGEKMSSSKGNYISVRDSEEDVRRKIRKAFCPEKQIENNPVIQIAQYHIFPRFEKVVIERDERFGGDVEYLSFEELRKDYMEGKLHPMDLKMSIANYLNKILDNTRKKLNQT
ncbi:tyrosyl-tRNA synthetase [Archaeoglobus sulfaticallidus PM70-1]|uniref:Tyrosine--tRNA ligase n=1 Tax=Archaeoglobus sulfaticallidus PM70-1 TaxID=387631 RepID=N0BBJ3_9EURY|nr:tyrosine--tRNA ligase [Archaeoglobus sulfaticallidus]AGK60378.1 tyrosyl-tRNA synthetase [Archaeoglobus sulfaticallidus PM70-1]